MGISIQCNNIFRYLHLQLFVMHLHLLILSLDLKAILIERQAVEELRLHMVLVDIHLIETIVFIHHHLRCLYMECHRYHLHLGYLQTLVSSRLHFLEILIIVIIILSIIIIFIKILIFTIP